MHHAAIHTQHLPLITARLGNGYLQVLHMPRRFCVYQRSQVHICTPACPPPRARAVLHAHAPKPPPWRHRSCARVTTARSERTPRPAIDTSSLHTWHPLHQAACAQQKLQVAAGISRPVMCRRGGSFRSALQGSMRVCASYTVPSWIDAHAWRTVRKHPVRPSGVGHSTQHSSRTPQHTAHQPHSTAQHPTNRPNQSHRLSLPLCMHSAEHAHPPVRCHVTLHAQQHPQHPP